MSIASEITRLQGVKSDILTAISNKGVTVPAGSALDDCPGLIGDIGKIENITIAGTTYPVVKIDEKYWMAKNLAYHTSSFSYPNNDSSTEADCGLLYKLKVVQDEIYPLIPAGWRMPRKDDFVELFTNHPNQLDYISVPKGGNDSLGFGDNLAGTKNTTGSIARYGEKSLYWTDVYSDFNLLDSTYFIRFCDGVIGLDGLNALDKSIGDNTSNANEVYELSVRLVRDT